MLDIKQKNINNHLLRNSSTIPFFYKKFLPVHKYIDNILHLINMGKMANGLLHDLVSPLTSLTLSINHKNTGIQEIEKINKELSDFINIVRMQIKNQCIREKFTLSDVIKNSCILLKYKSTLNNIRLVTIISEDFNLFGNKLSLVRVLINLINNAIESYENCPSGKRDVIVSVYKEKQYINISVKDFGCGISNKNKKKIFKYLYTNKRNGTGLGLYISNKNIRREFSGKIILFDKEISGSNFIIKIPFQS